MLIINCTLKRLTTMLIINCTLKCYCLYSAGLQSVICAGDLCLK